MISKKASWILQILMMAFVLPSCERAKQVKETAMDFAVDLIPTDAIETIDKNSWAQMQLRLETLKNDEVQSALRLLLKPLIAAAESRGTPKYTWDIHVIKSTELNAFALPGGTLGINSGLIEYSQTGSEMVGILAHEVAHVAAKHGVKSMMLEMGVSFITSTLIASLFGDMSGVLDSATNTAAKLGLLKFSRDNEREADTLGAEFLQKANYPISGLAVFFKDLEKQQNPVHKPGFADNVLSLLSTHPMSTERAQNLELLASAQKVTELQKTQSVQYQLIRRHILQLK